MPLAPPVMIATLPFKSYMAFSCDRNTGFVM
jgi:hypothetical protein